MPGWLETNFAPDHHGGKWQYYRYSGNNNGFIGNRQATAVISYNKTVHFDNLNNAVANDTHVTAHVKYTSKATGQTDEFVVRFYHTTQNLVYPGHQPATDPDIDQYIQASLAHLANAN